MNAPTTDLPRMKPTPSQLALAEAVREGVTREAAPGQTVPASRYTDPAHFAREKAALFDRSKSSVATWLFRIARNRRIEIEVLDP